MRYQGIKGYFKFLGYGALAILLISLAIALREIATASVLSPQALEIMDKTESALSGKNLIIVAKYEMGRWHLWRLEGPLPNEEKIIMDTSGRVRVEYKTLVGGKLTPLRPGGKFLQDAKGRLVIASSLQPTINLYDGKYLWIYDPYDNKYSKREKTRDFTKVIRRFHLSNCIPLKENLVQALPSINKIDVKRTKFEGRESFLITIYVQNKEKAKYWIDAQTYLPLQSEFQSRDEQGLYIHRRKVLKITLNPKLPPDTFLFIPPKDAKLRDL